MFVNVQQGILVIDVRELTANLHAEMEDIADDKINVFALQDTLAADVRYVSKSGETIK